VRGRQILVEPLPAGGHAAALLIDGRLEDLLIDPGPAEPTPRPEAIYRALPARPMKGTGGAIVDLGTGLTGFLRGARLPDPGRPLLVQVTGWAEPRKAPPVTQRVALRGRTAVLTPGAPGRNVARTIGDPARRATLEALAGRAMAGAEPDLGLILRSASAAADDAAIAAEVAALRAEWQALAAAPDTAPGLVRPAPGAAKLARRDWTTGAEALREAPTALADAGVWEEVEALSRPAVALGPGSLSIEPTRALVAVDVDTGADLSPAAALKANLAAAAELPRQLRLRGLGGQVTVDFAPLARSDRAQVERALARALRADGIDTAVVGWTPLGHLELQRRRLRRPLTDLR
jgi:Ribonuclease G/E